jgi:hypothetical protein
MYPLIGLLIFVGAGVFAIVAFTRSSALFDASYITPLVDAVQHMPVKFDAAGMYVIYHEVLEKEHFLNRWRYLLWDPSNNSWIESRWAQNRKYPGAVAATRWRVRYLDVPHPGDYQLVVDGLEAGDRMKIILGRGDVAPDMWQTVGILSVLVAGFAMIVTAIVVAGS